jgi:tetratricopeptide (TPR) repeat protein
VNFFAFPKRTLAALLVLLAVAAYLPAIGAGYVWDDDTLLTANPQMRGAAGLVEIWEGVRSRDYTPVTLTVFWLEWRLWGDTPVGYHVVNILLHALSALLLWRILERLRVPGAWLGALLFAIHPVNAASVAWVAELKNTLSGALFFGSALTFLEAREGRRTYGLSLALFLLAALSKGAVVTLPAALLLCVLWLDGKLTRRDGIRLAGYCAIALLAALVTIRFQARAPHYGLIPDTLAYRIARAGAAVWFYLGALIWPVGLSPIRAQWLPDLRSPGAWLPAAGAAALGILFYLKRAGWGRPLLFGYAYFLAMLLPVLGFVWMTLMQETPVADWWQYLAAPGIFAVAGAGIALAARRWRMVTPVVCVAMALLMVQTWRRASIYHSMASYCLAVTAEDPHAWTLQNNLGILLKRAGRFAEAEQCFRRALRDNPGYAEAHINMGNAYGASGDIPSALAEYRTAAEMRPGDPQVAAALASLGGALIGAGNYASAEACFRQACVQEPESIALRIGLCQALLPQGKKEEALRVCGEVDRIAKASGNAIALAAAEKLRGDCNSAAGNR